MATKKLDLDNIQGNILAGFNKDHQVLLFLEFKDSAAGLEWLSKVRPDVTTTSAVMAFRAGRRNAPAGKKPQSVWTNVAFTYWGLRTLGRSEKELRPMGTAFIEGMHRRAPSLGDLNGSDRSNWLPAYRDPLLPHAVMIIGADTKAALEARLTKCRAALGAGVNELTCEVGKQLPNNREHFGFRDGISQPAVDGFDKKPTGPEGLIAAGEFVLGHPTQDDSWTKGGPRAPNTTPKAPVPPNPRWTADGSFLVFRRLVQDVGKFNAFLAAEAGSLKISEPRLAAMLVGRYRSGAPLGTVRVTGTTDLLSYDGDDITPRAAHIRKTNPRDGAPPAEKPKGQLGLPDVQKHRLIRRAIPFGDTWTTGETRPPRGGRGLLFLAYQANIETQFEFIQSRWMNNSDFPDAPEDNRLGHDAIAGQPDPAIDPRYFRMPAAKGSVGKRVDLGTWVTTSGGAYLFQPSLKGLETLAAG
ncbi:MAG: Dyp-type peroxidase [Dehalococcoidia bacterium]